MKRKAHTYGRKGKGGYYQAPVTTRRPAGSVQPITSTRKHGKEMKYINSIQEGAAGFSRLIRWSIAGAIIAAVLSVSMCAATVAHAQPRFAFHAQSVYRFQNGKMDILPAMEVQAFSDTLLFYHPGQPARPYYNIAWTRTDDGSLYYLTTGVHIVYQPGPGGQALYIRTATKEMGTITLEAYERNIIKN